MIEIGVESVQEYKAEGIHLYEVLSTGSETKEAVTGPEKVLPVSHE